jgi:hypothetical protein
MENKGLRPFTHRIYTDFSGDDGDPKTPGASKCLCGAWILSSEENIRYNEGIVLQIKKIIGCKAINELKYKSLAHHPKKSEALGLLLGLKVTIILTPVIKDKIDDKTIRSPKTKALLKIIHGFPLGRFMNYLGEVSPDFCLQLIIDEMSWSGYQKDVLEYLKSGLKDVDWSEVREDWLYFAKSGNSLMMQLADVVAGLGREYIEDLQTKALPPCRMCHLGHWNSCTFKRHGQRVGLNKLLKNALPSLLRNSEGSFYAGGFIVRPPEVESDYIFVECLHRKQ